MYRFTTTYLRRAALRRVSSPRPGPHDRFLFFSHPCAPFPTDAFAHPSIHRATIYHRKSPAPYSPHFLRAASRVLRTATGERGCQIDCAIIARSAFCRWIMNEKFRPSGILRLSKCIMYSGRRSIFRDFVTVL